MLGKALSTFHAFTEVRTTTHASSASYFTFLSLVPILAICISLVSLVGFGEREVLAFFATAVPDTLQELVAYLVHNAYDLGGLAFSVSTLSLIWTAAQGARALRAGLNAAYGVRESRSMVAVIIISVVSIFVLGVLVAVQMWMVFGYSVLSIVTSHLQAAIDQESVMNVTNAALAVIFDALTLLLCYTFLPDGKRRIRDQLPGAVLAMLGNTIVSTGFRIYVEHFSKYNVLYGSIATVALLLFWMYVFFYIIIACGFINRRLTEGRAAKNAHPDETTDEQ